MKTVLLVNDDGIDAVGLETLKQALIEKGYSIYVAAPSSQQSGAGKGIKLRVKLEEREVPGTVMSWAIDAPPAAAVYIALKALLPQRPDIVVSGINHGPNLGFEDFLTSGTIGAAIEAALQGIPAIAVSTTDWEASRREEFEPAARISAEIADQLIQGSLVSRWKSRAAPLIIVNSPVNPRRVVLARLAWNVYRTRIKVEGNTAFPIWEPERIYDLEAPPGTDIWAIRNGYASVVIVDLYNMAKNTSPENMEALRYAETIIEKINAQIFEE